MEVPSNLRPFPEQGLATSYGSPSHALRMLFVYLGQLVFN